MAANSNRRRVTTRKPKKSLPKNEIRKDTSKDVRVQTGPGPPIRVSTAIKAFLSARLCSAIWSHISDCDETYNYWEPSHYLMYMKGLQTWEYSPEYGLRSYTYLLLHLLPAYFYDQLFHPTRVLIFYLMRCVLGLMCALCECYFYVSVSREFGQEVGRIILVFLVISPGMFIASTAFLPSSFSMYMVMLTMGAWYSRHYELAIFTTALSAFLSWPFSVLVSAFIAVDMLLIRNLRASFFKWSIFSTFFILGPMWKIDSDLYGKFVLAPWNIVKYNVLTKHGPSLYGVEPVTFYFLNGFLNFNVVFLLAISTPVLVYVNILVTSPKSKIPIRFWLFIAPFFLWMLVFTAQPHKEERFLFPVYPMICLCGAVSLSALQSIYSTLVSSWRSWLNSNHIVIAAVMLVGCLLGVSRIFALYRGYHAPMDVWMELNKLHTDGKVPEGVAINVCVGKEWYRYPSSFFLPADSWNIRFIKSEFRGQLPAEYTPTADGAALVHPHFNDQNKEEASRYFDIRKCHFLIDLDLGRSSELEPNYSRQSDKWFVRMSVPFLDAERSHKLFRAFYIPFISEKYCVYGNYSLLQSTRVMLRE